MSNVRNYEAFWKVFDIELFKLSTCAQDINSDKWKLLRREYESNLKTLYENREHVKDIIKRLQPFTRRTERGVVMISAELKELVKALEGVV